MENRILWIVFHDLTLKKIWKSQGGDSLTIGVILTFFWKNGHNFSGSQKLMVNRIREGVGIIFHNLAPKKLWKSTIKTYVLHTTEINTVLVLSDDTSAPTVIENLEQSKNHEAGIPSPCHHYCNFHYFLGKTAIISSIFSGGWNNFLWRLKATGK